MAKKTAAKIAAKGADQYMLRLPPGLRDRVAKRAGENGRSINTEIIDAIEKHLVGADRIAQLWAFMEKHRATIEAIPEIEQSLENLKYEIRPLIDERDYAAMIRADGERKARVANLPPITAEQAVAIRRLIQETEADEARLLKLLRASSVEGIRDFDRAVSVLEQRRRPGPPDPLDEDMPGG
jgi:hypothetical protein